MNHPMFLAFPEGSLEETHRGICNGAAVLLGNDFADYVEISYTHSSSNRI